MRKTSESPVIRGEGKKILGFAPSALSCCHSDALRTTGQIFPKKKIALQHGGGRVGTKLRMGPWLELP